MQYDDWSLAASFSADDLYAVYSAELHADPFQSFFSKDKQSIWRRHTPCPVCLTRQARSARTRCEFGEHCGFATRPDTNFAFGERGPGLASDLFHHQRTAFLRLSPPPSPSPPEVVVVQQRTPPPLPQSRSHEQKLLLPQPVASNDPDIEMGLFEYTRRHGISLKLLVPFTYTGRRTGNGCHRAVASLHGLLVQFQAQAVRHYFEYHLSRQRQPLILDNHVVQPPRFPFSMGDMARFRCHQCHSSDLWGTVCVTSHNRQLRPPLGTFRCRQCDSRTFMGIYLIDADCNDNT